MSRRHTMRRGDKVSDTRRGEHVNGFIIRILYDDGPDEVLVRFDDGIEVYDWSEFEFAWTNSYGGAYVLSQTSKAAEKASAKANEV